MGTTLLAIDGGEYARRTARKAIDMASDRGSTLHVMCVVDRHRFDEPALSTTELTTMSVEDHAHECIDEIAAMAADAGVPVVGKHCHGIPRETILGYADDVDAEVIVVSEHSDRKRVAALGRRIDRMTDREVVVGGLQTVS